MMRFKYFIMESGEEFSKHLEKKHGVRVDLFDRGEGLHLYHLVVPKERRKQGVGSAVMKDINDYADQHGKTVTLQTAVKDDFHGTTSQSRLKRFYKKHDYVENKGRNKDFSLSGNMYRMPKK